MTIQYTPIYQIPYPQASDPIKTTQTTLENQAKRIEQVFTDASFPASNPDVASMTARLNALEANTRMKRMEFRTAVPFGVTANVQWDIGPLVAYNPAGQNKQTPGTAFANTTGAPSGGINITESGFYTVDVFLTTTANPGSTFINIWTPSSADRLSQEGNNAQTWESQAGNRVPFYLPAGTTVRCSYMATSGHSINSRLSIVKWGTLGSWGL